MAKYTTNFIQTNKGNSLQVGQDLIITISDAETITARLDRKAKNRWEPIQVAQKNGHTLKLVMKGKDKLPLPSGEYRVHTWYWDGKNGGSFKDVFFIY